MTTKTGSGRIEVSKAAMSEAAQHRVAGDAKSAFAAPSERMY